MSHVCTHARTRTHVHLHAKLLCSSCTVLPDSLAVTITSPSLLQACVCVFAYLGVCFHVCACQCACVYNDNLVFHRVSSLPSKTQPQEEDHSSFTPSYHTVHKHTGGICNTQANTFCCGVCGRLYYVQLLFQWRSERRSDQLPTKQNIFILHG